jgi:hypothetical protein
MHVYYRFLAVVEVCVGREDADGVGVDGVGVLLNLKRRVVPPELGSGLCGFPRLSYCSREQFRPFLPLYLPTETNRRRLRQATRRTR